MKYRPIFAVLCAVTFFSSCSSSRKATSKTIYPADSLPALPPSTINLPIAIYAPPLLAKMEKILPKEFESEAWPDYVQTSCDFRYKYRFLRSPLTITCTNNTIGVQFTGSYQLAGGRCLCTAGKPVTPWISGSCGFGKEPMRRIDISIISQLEFLPSYQLRTATRVAKLQALDKCFVSLFSSDVTELVLDSTRSSVASFCSTLDQTLGGLSFLGIEQVLAQKAYQKTNLGKYGSLLINPIALGMGRLNYARDSLEISIGFSCQPELSSDSTNSGPVRRSLPPLGQQENGRSLSLYLNANYDYAFLSKLLSDSLHNRVFEIRGRTVVIKEIGLRGIGNHQVEVKIDFGGTDKGSIYLRGTPVLDTAKQTLTIPDINYTLEGQDLALKLARSLFRNKIRKTLQGKSYLDIATLVKSNMHILDEQMNRQLTKGIYSSGKANDIRIIGLMAHQNSLQVQVFIDADISIKSDGLF